MQVEQGDGVPERQVDEDWQDSQTGAEVIRHESGEGVANTFAYPQNWTKEWTWEWSTREKRRGHPS